MINSQARSQTQRLCTATEDFDTQLELMRFEQGVRITDEQNEIIQEAIEFDKLIIQKTRKWADQYGEMTLRFANSINATIPQGVEDRD